MRPPLPATPRSKAELALHAPPSDPHPVTKTGASQQVGRWQLWSGGVQSTLWPMAVGGYFSPFLQSHPHISPWGGEWGVAAGLASAGTDLGRCD